MTRVRTSEPHLDQQLHTSDWQRDRMTVWANDDQPATGGWSLALVVFACIMFWTVIGGLFIHYVLG